MHAIIESKFYALSVEKKEPSLLPAVWSQSKTSPSAIFGVQLFCPMQRNIIWYIYSTNNSYYRYITYLHQTSRLPFRLWYVMTIIPILWKCIEKKWYFKYSSICVSIDKNTRVWMLWIIKLFPSDITLKNLGYKII